MELIKSQTIEVTGKLVELRMCYDSCEIHERPYSLIYRGNFAPRVRQFKTMQAVEKAFNKEIKSTT